MFTGIIEARGEITGIEPGDEFFKLRIRSDLDLEDVRVGDSIAVDGACLTATVIIPNSNEFVADVSPETLSRTTLADLKIRTKVNLEKAMKMGDRFGGHMVAGHVDCVGRMTEKRKRGVGFQLGFQVDSGRYLIEKGSVAIDGVSLTVNTVTDNRFEVMLIPQTSQLTGLTEKNINDKVNVEFDFIGKYIEKFVLTADGRTGITEHKLKEFGYL